MRLNKKDLSEKLRVSQRSLTNWQKEGLPVLEHGRRGQPNIYDLAAVVRWLKKSIHGSNYRSTGGFIDFHALDRELNADLPVQAPAKTFPDSETIEEIEVASGSSWIEAAAWMVQLFKLDPITALHCAEITFHEQCSAFEDVHGDLSGPMKMRGDMIAVNYPEAFPKLAERVRDRVAEIGGRIGRIRGIFSR
jgi:hypothetical protein